MSALHLSLGILCDTGYKSISIYKQQLALVWPTAKELIENGATVIITGRRKETIEKTGKEIRAIPFRWCLFSKAGIVLVHGLKDFNWMFVAFLKDKKSRGRH